MHAQKYVEELQIHSKFTRWKFMVNTTSAFRETIRETIRETMLLENHNKSTMNEPQAFTLTMK